MRDLPLPYARSALEKFSEFFDIHFLTARNFEGGKQITQDWLDLFGFPYRSIEIVNSIGDKPDFLKSRECHLFIDDFTVGQELSIQTVRFDIMERLTVPYEHFQGDWQAIEKKYLRLLPNGERFFVFMTRNLDWWRASRSYEAVSRKRYYENFARVAGLDLNAYIEAAVGEIGAGPFGGMIEVLGMRARRKVFIDILANSLRNLRFIEWPANAEFVESPAEEIPLPDNYLDLVLSYNALDHGWDILESLKEAIRISKRTLVAFDCKSNTAPPEDRLDHYQGVSFYEVVKALNGIAMGLGATKVSCYNLVDRSPGFQFDCNWGFPVMVIDVSK